METMGQNNLWIFVVAMLWTLPWKGYALWTASKMGHKRWFIVLIVLNTLAILDIFYIFYVAKKTPSEFLKVLKTKI
jgi:hypothetical protein